MSATMKQALRALRFGQQNGASPQNEDQNNADSPECRQTGGPSRTESARSMEKSPTRQVTSAERPEPASNEG